MLFVKELLPDKTRFFAGHCPMFGAIIQACSKDKIKTWRAMIDVNIQLARDNRKERLFLAFSLAQF